MILCPEAQFLVPDWGYEAGYGVGLSNRPASLHCKKGIGFPVPSRDVTDHTLPGRESLNYSIPMQGEFGKWHPGWGRENH